MFDSFIFEKRMPLARSLWIYQQERFPLLMNGILIAFLTASGICYSSFVSGAASLPSAAEMTAGYLTVLLLFLLMRCFDEFKDAEDDARYRPYRPVQRGVVSLRTIGWLAVSCVCVQLLLQWLWLPGQFLLLLLIYGYLGLMSCEFGVSHWLKQRPMLYALSHMLIMPLIGLYVTGLDWQRSGYLPSGVLPFTALLFVAGFVIEIGRKIRAPESEETGVDTYSAVYGVPVAALLWLSSLVGSFFCLLWLLRATHVPVVIGILLVGLLLVGLTLTFRYIRRPIVTKATQIELYSGMWTVVLFATIAVSAYASMLENWT
jgi:hypothetical protein